MKRSMLTITSAVCAAGLIAIIVGSHTLSAQDEHADKGDKDKPPPDATTRTRLGFSPPI